MRQVSELIRAYKAAGFTLVRSKKHLIFQCPCGHAQLVDTSTRCGGRGGTNAKARIARTLRACTPLEECA